VCVCVWQVQQKFVEGEHTTKLYKLQNYESQFGGRKFDMRMVI